MGKGIGLLFLIIAWPECNYMECSERVDVC